MRKLTTQEFIEKSNAVHGSLYDYSKSEYVNANTPVIIICRKHGEFSQLPSNHLRGAGCKFCTKVEGRSLGKPEFVRKACDVHGNKYDYSKVVYKNSRTHVEIICPEHGSFFQSPGKHIAGVGCPKCASNCKDTRESFIEKAKKIHGDFYDYSKVVYVNESTKVCIVDKEYGEFWQTPNSHLNGRGCPMRRGEKTLETKRALDSGYQNEDGVYTLLCDKFGVDNVFREYWSQRYPFFCDFYISTFDIYMEINAHGTHGGHWFDPICEKDLERLCVCASKADKSSWYRKCIDIWTKSDVAKRNVAIQNDLNYVVFWKNDLSDFMQWYDSFDFSNPVLKLF